MTVTRRIAGHLFRSCRCRAANQRVNYECCRIVDSARSYHFIVAVWRAKEAESTHMNPRNAIVAILAALSLSLALADDFKTINGKEYKNVTVSRVEADGIVIKTKTGLSKIYFAELPKDVQERFHYGPSTPIGKAVTQRINEAESGKPPAAFLDA